MSIRIRKVDGYLIALCGYETDAKPGDLYLDDNVQYALASKNHRDRREAIEHGGKDIPALYPEHDERNEKEKIRSCWERTDLGPRI